MSYSVLNPLTAAFHLNPKGSSEPTDFNKVFQCIANSTRQITSAAWAFGRQVWAIASDATGRFIRYMEDDLPKSTELQERTVAVDGASQATQTNKPTHCLQRALNNIFRESLCQFIGPELFEKPGVLQQPTSGSHRVRHNILRESLRQFIGSELFEKLGVLQQLTKEKQLPLQVVQFISDIRALKRTQ